MKVLFLSAWYPNRNDAMFGLFVRKHAQAVALYAEVAVLYVVADNKIKNYDIIEQKIDGVNELIVYYPVHGNGYFFKICQLFNYLRAYYIGIKLIHKSWGKPSIIQVSVFTRTALIAYFYKLIFRTPYVVIEHWTRYFHQESIGNSFHKKLTQFAVRKASAVMPVTEHLMHNMLRHGLNNDNYVVVNNVVDSVFFKHNIRNAELIKSIVCVSSFDDKQKNLSGLLSAIAKLYAVRQDFKLTIVGSGVDYPKIVKLATELNLIEKAVFFTGMLQGEALVDKYYESDFSVLYSNYENIPVVISESLVCGKPVISTNVGGISEHINSTNGILIDKNNEESFLSALNFMLDNINLFDSKLIKANAAEKYSFENVGKILFNHYKSVISIK